MEGPFQLAVALPLFLPTTVPQIGLLWIESICSETMDTHNFCQGSRRENGERKKKYGSFLSPIVSCKHLSEMTTVFSFLSLIAMFVRRVGFF